MPMDRRAEFTRSRLVDLTCERRPDNDTYLDKYGRTKRTDAVSTKQQAHPVRPAAGRAWERGRVGGRCAQPWRLLAGLKKRLCRQASCDEAMQSFLSSDFAAARRIYASLLAECGEDNVTEMTCCLLNNLAACSHHLEQWEEAYQARRACRGARMRRRARGCPGEARAHPRLAAPCACVRSSTTVRGRASWS